MQLPLAVLLATSELPSTMNKVSMLVVVLLAAGCSSSSGNSAPAAQPSTAPAPQTPEAPAMPASVVDVAMSSPDHTTLVEALQVAGLVETLRGEGPFTVFAPTDAAFAKLPEGALQDLLADPEQLGMVLQHHVVPGKVMAADVAGIDEAETLAGTSFPVDASGAGVMVGDAQVAATDLEAENGVVHVIDTVLLPEESPER
jgi:uncharacterized surface protein with fasciclin (FAS1) repeats